MADILKRRGLDVQLIDAEMQGGSETAKAEMAAEVESLLEEPVVPKANAEERARAFPDRVQRACLDTDVG